jgi:apolipoprotein N-acyltransferase
VTFQSLADHVILSWGWRRRLIALGAGAAGALAMPPFGLWPLLAVPLTLAIWLLDGVTAQSRTGLFWRAFGAGWWWGLGYHVAGLWWLGAAFLVEADQFAWAMPLGVLGLPSVLAVFSGLAFALARIFWPPGLARIILFAVMLAGAEWLRGHVLTGFPWNSLGMALGQNLWLAQNAAWAGLHGLTLLAALVFSSPAALATGDTIMRRWAPPVLAAATLVALAGFGAWRIPATPSPLVAGVKLRIMQPNLPQDAKFRPEAGEAILNQYLALSDRATGPGTLGLQDTTHLIWPESAFPFLLERTPQALSRIQAALPANVTLITGAARAGEALPGEGRPPIYNAIQVVTKGAITATADKVHLVPFGEYVPGIFESAIRSLGLRQFIAIPGGFSAAAQRKGLRIPGLPLAAPLICYEAIFPGSAVPAGPRPGLLLNLTNDGWFGRSTGPYQHLAQARLRAIEEGLPLVRAANTGISAVFDGYGRPLAVLGLGESGVLDAGLPQVVSATVYSRFGDGIFSFAIVVSGIGMFWNRGGRSRQSIPK